MARLREQIKVKALLGVLQGDAFGDKVISDGRRKSIEILLRKSLPDLASVQISGGDGGPLAFTVSWANTCSTSNPS